MLENLSIEVHAFLLFLPMVGDFFFAISNLILSLASSDIISFSQRFAYICRNESF